MGGKGSGRKRTDINAGIPEVSVPEPGVEIERRWIAVGAPVWKHGPHDVDGFPWHVDQGMITNPIGGQGGRTLDNWKDDLEKGRWKFGPTWSFANHTIQWVWREKIAE